MKPVHWVSAGVFSLVISWGAHAANVGMVLDVSGSVSANWQGRKVGLDIATALDPGVRIEVEKGASFSFIFYPTRQQLTTQGPATFVIQEQTVNQTRGTAMASRSLPENRAVAAMGFQSQVVPAALVMKTGMDNPARPNLLEPRNRETVLADRPVFEWSAANGATAFDFSLTYNGTVVHQQRVNGTRLELPQGVSLLSGAEYRWQVVPVGSGLLVELLPDLEPGGVELALVQVPLPTGKQADGVYKHQPLRQPKQVGVDDRANSTISPANLVAIAARSGPSPVKPSVPGIDKLSKANGISSP